MADVVFMGTPDFAEGILQALLESEYAVTAVFTQPDRPKGRKGQLQAPPVKELALEHGIPVYQPARIRSEENVEILRQLHPDFIVVAAFGQIIPPAILEIPPYGCLNVHASLLPRWRGAAPIQWAILEGDEKSGVTIMQMAEGLDTGDCIDQAEVRIEADDTGGSLFDKLMHAGASQLIETMRRIERGEAQKTPQPEESPTPYAKMLTRQMGEIDWTKSAPEIERMIRALDPWPSAFTFLDGKMLKIWKASVLDAAGQAAEEDTAGVPGRILSVGKDELIVQTGDGCLGLLEVQPEGRKRMNADAYIRGYHPQAGALLGEK